MPHFQINATHYFGKKYSKITKKDAPLKIKIRKTVIAMAKDPFSNELNTHKSNTRLFGLRYSSKVTGDLRIIWDFNENQINIIDLLDIGGHEGSKKVYN